MPRIAKGPYLKRRKQAGAVPRYYIIDGDKRESTGFTAKQTVQAKQALETHVRARHVPKPGPDYYVSQALDLYQRDIVPNHSAPENTIRYIERLLEFFKGMACDDITPAATASYERWRTRVGKPSLNEPPRSRTPVKPTTVRRELSTLRAAFVHAWKCRKLKNQIPVNLPPDSPPKERWLTTGEATRLLMGALGCIPSAVNRHRHQTRALDDMEA
jgi:hypothetical protein